MKYRVYMLVRSSFAVEADSLSEAESKGGEMIDSRTIAELVNEHEASLESVEMTGVDQVD